MLCWDKGLRLHGDNISKKPATASVVTEYDPQYLYCKFFHYIIYPIFFFLLTLLYRRLRKENSNVGISSTMRTDSLSICWSQCCSGYGLSIKTMRFTTVPNTGKEGNLRLV